MTLQGRRPPCARSPAEQRRKDQAQPPRTKSPPLPFSVFFSSTDWMDGSGSAACHVRPIAPRLGSRCRCIAGALLHTQTQTQTQTQTDYIPHPLPPVTSACRAVGCRPAKERHWISLWRSTCSGIWLHWSGRNSGPFLQLSAGWTGDNHFDPIEIRLPLRSISHSHLRNHTHTLQTQSTRDSRTDRRIRHKALPLLGLKDWEDYTASCSLWAIFSATARRGEMHSNQLAVQLSTTALTTSSTKGKSGSSRRRGLVRCR